MVDGSEEAHLLVVGKGDFAGDPVAAARDLRDPVSQTAVDGDALFIVCLARFNVVPRDVVLVDTGISQLAVEVHALKVCLEELLPRVLLGFLDGKLAVYRIAELLSLLS